MTAGLFFDGVDEVAAERAAIALRELLHAGKYAEVSALLRHSSLTTPFVEPFTGHRIRDAIAELPALSDLLVRVFTLGATVDVAEADAVLGAATVERLLAIGVLAHTGGGVRSCFIVACFLNRYLLVSPPLWVRGYDPDEPLVYVGRDTYRMAQLVAQRGPVGRVLDLCTGAGLLTMVADAEHVVGIDIDPEVAGVARFNILLNGLERRVEVRDGDLYSALAEDERFDLIVANPPFLPAPDGVTLPRSADGGPDGEAILRRTLDGVEDRLTPDGRALVYAQGFGTEAEPVLAAWLREALAGTSLHATLLVTDGQSLESAGVSVRQLWQATGSSEDEAYAAWQRFCERPDLTAHHTFLVDVAHGDGGSVSVHRLLGS